MRLSLCLSPAARSAGVASTSTSAAFSGPRPQLLRPHPQRSSPVRAQAAATKLATPPPAITLTDGALAHLQRLRAESGGEGLLLRMGVKSGGCSGMSYFMDFEQEANIRPDDAVMQYEGGFKLVCDSKSLLYLFGMRLDYSNALIGGGFQFNNPNAESSCGCGKSFGV